MMAILSLLGGMAMGMASTPLTAALQPITVDVEQRAWAFHPVKQSDVITLINLYMRGLITKEEFINRMKENGYDEKKAEEYFNVAQQILNANELIQAKWRGIIDEKEYYRRMAANGYDKETADVLEHVMKYYPSPEDFIRFAVRDVFNPDRVRKYQLDIEFPTEIVKYAEEAGMDADILKWYWMAHWELPSPEQVLRMVNMLQPAVLDTRLPDGTRYGDKYRDFGIDPDKIRTDYNDLSEYLAMADISPYWRDRFKALTFPPLTRVDLRRIYELGLISDEELRARLLELGYSFKDAERLMEFYKMYKHRAGRTLTRTMITRAYIEHILTRNDAINMLEQIGYSKDEAEFIIKLEEAKERDKEIKEEVQALTELYKKGAITLDELKSKLQSLNLPDLTVEYYLAKAQRVKKKTVKLPSKHDLIEWLKKGIITEDEFTKIMRQIGYPDEFIQKYIEEVKLNE